jgi:hypothetical protein
MTTGRRPVSSREREIKKGCVVRESSFVRRCLLSNFIHLLSERGLIRSPFFSFYIVKCLGFYQEEEEEEEEEEKEKEKAIGFMSSGH